MGEGHRRLDRTFDTVLDCGLFHTFSDPERVLEDSMRDMPAPDRALLDFLQSTYEAAANAAKWDRDALECAPGQPGVVRQI